jgi:hypothetical protein
MTDRRKELIKEYRETPRPMGVGVVRNTVNGKAYVFSGRDLPALLNRNQAQLRLQAHPNKALQADWDRHGRDAFAFEVLDTLPASEDPAADPTDDLRALESLWIEKLAPFEPAGYHKPPRR